MNELGERSGILHRNVGEYAAEAGVNMLVAIGEKALNIADGFENVSRKKNAVRKCENNDEAIAALRAIVKDGDTVLVKGSRTYGTEEVVLALTEGMSER
jgi:UDP-N-acetylmuramoyl-tripeptide--D-alanyl-D-alanine ligase